MGRLQPRISTGQPSGEDPAHHPGDELLLDHAIGAASPAQALLIDLHLAFCARCAQIARDLLAVGGAMLDAIEPAFAAPQMFNKTLQAIGRDGQKALSEKSAIPRAPSFAAGWPAPLRTQVIANHLTRWRWLPAGFRALRIPFADSDARVWVMKAPGGRGPFTHTHVGEEWTVVLDGGFSDETGRYEAGDFVIAGPGDEHHTVAEPGEGCVCVLLVRAEPVYTTWPGKLLAPFVRI
jgi:putative transcriptional regulator